MKIKMRIAWAVGNHLVLDGKLGWGVHGFGTVEDEREHASRDLAASCMRDGVEATGWIDVEVEIPDPIIGEPTVTVSPTPKASPLFPTRKETDR